ncbi:MAG: hypothetical protein HY452_00365 [Parcubacteria group bacterium]|nr:hypothetical protein [Parcubacteria group bacterium]
MARSEGKPKQQVVDATAFAACVLMEKLDKLLSAKLAGWGCHSRGFHFVVLFVCEMSVDGSFLIRPKNINTPAANFMRDLLAKQRS